MGAKVTIEIEGLQTVLSNLDSIGKQAPSNLEKQTAQLAKDTLDAWKNATPRRTGRLAAGSSAPAGGLQFTLNNGVRYYSFVSEGHQTPAGWHTRHGYRPAKRRSHVGGKFMTEKAIQFVSDNIEPYLSKFID